MFKNWLLNGKSQNVAQRQEIMTVTKKLVNVTDFDEMSRKDERQDICTDRDSDVSLCEALPLDDSDPLLSNCQSIQPLQVETQFPVISMAAGAEGTALPESPTNVHGTMEDAEIGIPEAADVALPDSPLTMND